MIDRSKFQAFLPFLILIGIFAGCRGMVSTQPGPTGNPETLPATADTSGSTARPDSRFDSTPLPGIPDLRSTGILPPGLEPVPPTDDEPLGGEVPAGILDEITADLVKQSSAAWEDIHIVRAEAVVWNDGSLGCPKPGESYIQMMINGYWVVLEVEGQEYDYRVSDTGSFILCEGRRLPPTGLFFADESSTQNKTKSSPLPPPESSRPVIIGPDDEPLEAPATPCARYCP